MPPSAASGQYAGLEIETFRDNYFNAFGRRQDPSGDYAAVIPKWTVALMHGDTVYVHGDGQTSRDLCVVANVVQANLLRATALTVFISKSVVISAKAAIQCGESATNQIFNVVLGEKTSLDELFTLLRNNLASHVLGPPTQPVYRDRRTGDVRHIQAYIGKAQRLLGYAPTHPLADGIACAMHWYLGQE